MANLVLGRERKLEVSFWNSDLSEDLYMVGPSSRVRVQKEVRQRHLQRWQTAI